MFKFKGLRDFHCSVASFSFFYVLFSILLFGRLFFQKLIEVNSSPLFVSAAMFIIFVIFFVVANLLFWKGVTKFWAILFVVLNVAALYFMQTYKVSINGDMLENVLETDTHEIEDLLSWRMLWVLPVYGILPVLLILKTKIEYKSFAKEVVTKLLILFGGLAVISAIVFPNYKNTAQFLRNNRSIRYYLLPSNYVGAVISVVKQEIRQNKKFVTIGEDAKLVPYWKNNGKKNLFVLVVGETARAKNFSLGGYERQTNEPLSKYVKDILYFSDFTTCGTSTAIAVPCMFSKNGRDGFKKGSGAYTENFLDIIKRQGYDVWWRENNSGCKNMCDRVETERLQCNGECFDEKLAEGLKAKAMSKSGNQFVVLHQMGSHGPTYYKRYPAQFQKYKPFCNTEFLDKCSEQEIINVYDNTIYYTSKVLADIIGELQGLSGQYNVVMVYLSDHGESLGESGIYLHAAPFFIAPDEQLKIPFLIWIPDAAADNLNIDKKCLQKQQHKGLSQDILFHSMLGLSGIKSSEYDEKLDIFASCKKQ